MKLSLKPERLSVAVLWPNIGQNLESALNLINQTSGVEIIRIIRLDDLNIKKFIGFIYKNDSVNPIHLSGKVKYLKSLKGSVYLLVLSEAVPSIIRTGLKGNIINTQRMVSIKSGLRERFNNRDQDGMLDHNHVIHITDDEVDAMRIWFRYDYRFLIHEEINVLISMSRFTGLTAGIESLNRETKVKDIELSNLKARLILPNDRVEMSELNHTPHYLFLEGEHQQYKEYIAKNRGVRHKCFYSDKKFLKLYNYVLNSKNIDPIRVKKNGNHYEITDGLHRATILFYLRREKVSCEII